MMTKNKYINVTYIYKYDEGFKRKRSLSIGTFW